MESYRAHIKDALTSNKTGEPKSYCGKSIASEFHFVDATHAISNNQSLGRLLPCKECRQKIFEILNNELLKPETPAENN